MNLPFKAAVFAFFAVLSVATVLRADDGRQIQIHSSDAMKFDVATIEATVGEKLAVTLTNAGTLPKAAMAHNFVLLKAGTDVNAFSTAGLTHPATDYIAPEMADKVIAKSKLLGPGESDTVTFVAPAAGSYDYICTFPGHALAGMRGTLTVK